VLHHIHLRLTENNVAVITFDRPDKSANIFDEATLDELNLAINAVISLKATGVTFVSSKPTVFVAGADLNSLYQPLQKNWSDSSTRGRRYLIELLSYRFLP